MAVYKSLGTLGQISDSLFCGRKENKFESMSRKLTGKKAAIIAADDFEDLELFHPMYRLQEEGVETVVVGLTKDRVKGKKGYTITPKASIDQVSADDFDFLVIPGGKSPERLRLNTKSSGACEKLRPPEQGYSCHVPCRTDPGVRRHGKRPYDDMCSRDKRRHDKCWGTLC